MQDWKTALDMLESGEVRAANKIDGEWVANKEVKQMILESFKAGELKEFSDCHYHGFVDKHNLAPQTLKPEDGIRMVPGGSAIRRGAYVSKGCILMPPAYVNVGAYVDEGTMVDSHALVGSCAQIGKHVHLSAGVQIGGVLEPIGLAPVVVEDNAFIGAGAVIVEGFQVRQGAVIAPNVALSKGTPVYDCVNEKTITDRIIPENAVVVPGSRPINKKNAWAAEQGLALNCAIIIKYKDEKTQASLELEEFLR